MFDLYGKYILRIIVNQLSVVSCQILSFRNQQIHPAVKTNIGQTFSDTLDTMSDN